MKQNIKSWFYVVEMMFAHGGMGIVIKNIIKKHYWG